MSEQLVSVKTYHLAGDDVKVEISMVDPDELKLVWDDKEGERTFSGRAIYRETTELGLMLSVILKHAQDSHTIILSIALPSANRPEDMRSIPVETFAVLTTALSSSNGPQEVEGQIENYKIVNLKGNVW